MHAQSVQSQQHNTFRFAICYGTLNYHVSMARVSKALIKACILDTYILGGGDPGTGD